MNISIVVPTYNRKEKLKVCLESLFRQDYPQENFEIIVVDDGSSDGTKEMVADLSKKRPNLKFVSQLHRGPAAARNLGIKEAGAEIVGFTDNDCILKDDWARKMVETHGSDEYAIAIGGWTRTDVHNIKAAVSQFLSDGAIRTDINGRTEIVFFPTCNVSLKKNKIKEGFNEFFPLPAGEDLEFFWRIYKKKHRLVYKKEIEILHDCHVGIKSFLKQAYMYGRGNLLVQYLHKDHPLLKEIKIKTPIHFIAGLLINFIKIPRFSCLLGSRLINSYRHFNLYEKFRVYLYFILHKIMYLIGNSVEYIRLVKMSDNSALKVSDDTRQIPDKPEFIILDITHRCNLQCNICEIRKDKPIQEFTTQEVKALISQASEWGVKEFVLSGGEPMVRPDIFELLESVKEKKYRLGILTNGISLDKDYIERLLPYLTSGTLSLSISLDALTPRIHDDIRGMRGCFEKTFRALKKLSELKGDYPSINFNVISIILNENFEELLLLANVLKSLNVNSIQFQPLLANNLIMKERSAKVKYWIPAERLGLLDQAIDSLVNFKNNNFHLVRNSVNNLRLVKKYFRGTLTNQDVECLYAVRTMLIANNGAVTTCFERYGDVRESLLKDIWFSASATQVRVNVKGCKRPCLLPCFVD